MNEQLIQVLTDLVNEIYEIHQLLADHMYDLKKNQEYCCNDYFHCPYKRNCEFASQCKFDSMIYEDKSK